MQPVKRCVLLFRSRNTSNPIRGKLTVEWGLLFSRGPGYAVSLRASEVDLQLTSAPHGPGQVKNANVRMKLLAGNIRAHSSAQELQPGISNYLIGSAHELWRTGVPHYGRVEYRDVYPGIDLVYYGNQQQLEYDFVLGPHAGCAAAKIQLEFQGSKDVRIDDATGDIVITLRSGEIRQKAPVAFQKTPQGRKPVGGKYIRLGRNRVGIPGGNLRSR